MGIKSFAVRLGAASLVSAAFSAAPIPTMIGIAATEIVVGIVKVWYAPMNSHALLTPSYQTPEELIAVRRAEFNAEFPVLVAAMKAGK